MPGSPSEAPAGAPSPPPRGARARRAPPGPDAPARALVLVCLAIFAAEFLTMWSLHPEPISAQGLPRMIADSGALVAVAAPILHFLFVRPMTRILIDQERAQQALRAARDDLEARVRERTAALEEANRSLLREMEERALASEKAVFQAGLLDAVEQAVFATDPGGHVLYWNRHAESLFGWEADDVRGRPLADVAPVDVQGSCLGDVLSRCGTERGWRGEVRLARGGRPPLLAQMACSPVQGSAGDPSGFVYALVDLTERKLAEEALRYSEEKYSTLVENSPTGIFIVREGRIAFANPKFLEMVGRPRDEIGALAPHAIVHPEDWPAVSEIGERRLRGEPTPQEYEFRVVRPSGEVRWISARNTLVAFRQGVSILGNVQDVTERRQAEAALRASREALRGLSSRLLSAQEEERQRIARELHDSIGQSLSAIKFVVERALEGPWPDPAAHPRLALQGLVSTIQDSVEEVRRISMALRPSTLDDLGLVATVAWFAREFETLYPHIRIHREVEVAESEVPDELKTVIFRILQEALNNVAKHSGAHRVSVALKIEGGELELTVRDNGDGFDPRGARRASGTGGFGLPFMQERAELSGGTFSLESAPGRGTTLRARWVAAGSATA